MKKNNLQVLLASGLFLLLSQVTQSSTISVPEDHASIGEALDHAHPGDHLLVAPGTYHETDLILPSGVSLTGTGEGPEDTVIDGLGNGRIMSAICFSDPSTLENLTFINGMAQVNEGYDAYGGALFISFAQVEVRNCRFINNSAEASGGAVSLMRTGSSFIDCEFSANSAIKGGGGIDCTYEASPLIKDSRFTANGAAYGGAVSCRSGSNPVITDSAFLGNHSGGDFALGGAVMAFRESSPVLARCTFGENSADHGGALFLDSGLRGTLLSCTITSNTAAGQGAGILCNNASLEVKQSIIAFQEGPAVHCLGTATAQVIGSNIFGNQGGDWFGVLADQFGNVGNISVDPSFCETSGVSTGTYYLREESPCTVAGGAAVDMGAWPAGCEASGTSRGGSLLPNLGMERPRAFPNPFNPRTSITFELPTSRQVRVAIYNLKGQRVRALANRTFEAGPRSVVWEGRDDVGQQVASGTYFVVITDGVSNHRTKITMVK